MELARSIISLREDVRNPCQKSKILGFVREVAIFSGCGTSWNDIFVGISHVGDAIEVAFGIVNILKDVVVREEGVERK